MDGEGFLCEHCMKVWKEPETNPTPPLTAARGLDPIPRHVILPSPTTRQEQQRRVDLEAQKAEQQYQQQKSERAAKIKSISRLSLAEQASFLTRIAGRPFGQ